MNSFLEAFVINHPILIVVSWIVFFVFLFISLVFYLEGFFSRSKSFNSQDSIDAARYRFLREVCSNQALRVGSIHVVYMKETWHSIVLTSSDLDSAIDKAIGGG